MQYFSRFYQRLLEYKKQFGHLHVKYKYVDETGYKLGSVVHTVRTGLTKITPEEKETLNSIGFIWREKTKYVKFYELYEKLIEYVDEYGNCDVPADYVVDGIELGKEVKRLRRKKKSLKRNQIILLDELGFQWSPYHSKTSFEEIVSMLQEYKEIFGNYRVPSNYVREDGIKLGQLVKSIRVGNRKISEEQLARLHSMGIDMELRSTRITFEDFYSLLEQYHMEYGNVDVNRNYVTEDGIKLGNAVFNIRYGLRKITKEDKGKLDMLGFQWPAKEYSTRNKMDQGN